VSSGIHRLAAAGVGFRSKRSGGKLANSHAGRRPAVAGGIMQTGRDLGLRGAIPLLRNLPRWAFCCGLTAAQEAYAEMIGDPRYLAPPAAESFCGVLK
jgi:hypothetical protein